MSQTTAEASEDDHCTSRGDLDLSEIARANGMSAEAAEAVASIDATMARIRRSIMRRDFGKQLLARLGVDLEVAHLDVISAISHNRDWQNTQIREVTVGRVAERLGIDPSRASRLAADVVERGFVRRVASQADARRICLELTAKGDAFVAAIRDNKWQVFSRALARWPEDDLVTFARLLDRFSGWREDAMAASVEVISDALGEADRAGAGQHPQTDR